MDYLIAIVVFESVATTVLGLALWWGSRANKCLEAQLADLHRASLTAAQVAEKVGLSASTIRRLASQGRLAHFRVGRRYRFAFSLDKIPEVVAAALQATPMSIEEYSERYIEPAVKANPEKAMELVGEAVFGPGVLPKIVKGQQELPLDESPSQVRPTPIVPDTPPIGG